jgi:hypothetical protein
MPRARWMRSSLKGGETVSVDMSPAKDGTNVGTIARQTKQTAPFHPTSRRRNKDGGGGFEMSPILLSIDPRHGDSLRGGNGDGAEGHQERANAA